MQPDIDALIRDFVESVSVVPRPYREVIEAWRTSCPRLTVWKDAVDRGLVERRGDGLVMATDAGRAFASAHNRRVA